MLKERTAAVYVAAPDPMQELLIYAREMAEASQPSDVTWCDLFELLARRIQGESLFSATEALGLPAPGEK